MIQQENTHQHRQPTDHSHCQISRGRPQRLLFLIMGNPHIGGKGHDLEKKKGGIKICRKKHPFCRSQCDKQEKVIAVSVPVMPKIFPGKQSTHKPHKRRDRAVQGSEAIHRKVKPHTAHTGKLRNLLTASV